MKYFSLKEAKRAVKTGMEEEHEHASGATVPSQLTEIYYTNASVLLVGRNCLVIFTERTLDWSHFLFNKFLMELIGP